MSSTVRRSFGASLRAACSRLWVAHLRSYSSSCMRARITAKLSAARIDSSPPAVSFYYLIGTGKERSGYVDPRGLRGPEIDDQLILGWRLHRHVRGLFSPQNAVDVAGCKP